MVANDDVGTVEPSVEERLAELRQQAQPLPDRPIGAALLGTLDALERVLEGSVPAAVYEVSIHLESLIQLLGAYPPAAVHAYELRGEPCLVDPDTDPDL